MKGSCLLSLEGTVVCSTGRAEFLAQMMIFPSSEAWPECAKDLGLDFLPSVGQGTCFSEVSPWWVTSGQGLLLIVQTSWKHLAMLGPRKDLYTFPSVHSSYFSHWPNLFLYFFTPILLQFFNKWHFFAIPSPPKNVETTCWAWCHHSHLSGEYLHVLGLCSHSKGHRQSVGLCPHHTRWRRRMERRGLLSWKPQSSGVRTPWTRTFLPEPFDLWPNLRHLRMSCAYSS